MLAWNNCLTSWLSLASIRSPHTIHWEATSAKPASQCLVPGLFFMVHYGVNASATSATVAPVRAPAARWRSELKAPLLRASCACRRRQKQTFGCQEHERPSHKDPFGVSQIGSKRKLSTWTRKTNLGTKWQGWRLRERIGVLQSTPG